MYPWNLFFVLLVMGLFGAVAVIPYSFALRGARVDDMPYSPLQLVLLTALQSGLMLAAAIGLGLLAAQAVGLEIPILTALLSGEPVDQLLETIVPIAVVSGAIAGGLVLALEVAIFRPRMPESIKEGAITPAIWKAFLASFYGGITEEILMRLFLMSGAVWLLSRLTNGVPTDGQFWFGIVFAALLFGLGHLPATAALAPLTPLTVIRAILLNALLGMVAGWLFWRYGLEAAMIAHFTADIVLHVLPAPFIRRGERRHAVETGAHPAGD